MAEQTAIEWTDASWSPWWGCQRVSPGCVHCYAESLSKRYGHDIWGPESIRRFLSDAHWHKPLIWDRKAREAGRIMRVFPSMCDPLEDRADLHGERLRFFAMVDQTPNLMWLILTKRPENWKFLPLHWLTKWPRNVMFGFTAEDRTRLEQRIGHWDKLYSTTRGLRTFISAEPLLESLGKFSPACYIDWVICGGESGPGARPMHPDWTRSLRDQCAAAGVPFLFKQWGEWIEFRQSKLIEYPPKHQTVEVQQTLISEQCSTITLCKVGKKAAGRLLDGVEHNGLPLYWPPNVGMIQQPNPLAVLA